MRQENTGLRWNYSVIPETGHCEEVGRYETYGIEVAGPGLRHTVHDVSVYKEVVNAMMERFNQYQLSPLHLEEAIIDLLP